jgi:hypothetical protein
MQGIENMVLFKLHQELRQAVESCPNCQGNREYSFTSRGRDNIVNCTRCEPVFKFMEPLEVALELLRGDSPY